MKEWIVPDEDIGVDGAYFGYVELLRCKDCKHYDRHDHRCKVWKHGINVEDFCSRAERKKE